MFDDSIKNRPSLCNAFIQSTRARIRETSRKLTYQPTTYSSTITYQ